MAGGASPPSAICASPKSTPHGTGDFQMYVNVAVLKETQAHERRVALTPKVAPKLIKLGAKLHMQRGAGRAIDIADTDYQDVVFLDDRAALLADADVVLAVQPPSLAVVDAM
jgi:NAD(P) transhydrogenase subunit alpha